VTDTNVIQRARDVLAKWREKAAPGPWEINEPLSKLNRSPDCVSIDTADDVDDPRNVTYYIPRWEAPLIVGTAGNPELLETLDGMLAAEQRRRASMHDNLSHDLSHHAERIAAAIIAADERMNA
jgi:hypothetical protein